MEVSIEVSIKIEYWTSLYRSPNKTLDEFNNVLLNFELLNDDIITKNSFSVLITNDVSVGITICWIMIFSQIMVIKLIDFPLMFKRSLI